MAGPPSLGAAMADRVGLEGWQPLVAVRRHGWVHRTSLGFTRRANSSTPLSSSHLRGDEAVEWLERRARVRGERCVLQLADHGDHDATIAALESRGVVGEDTTAVMVAPAVGGTAVSDSVQLADTVGDDWFDCWNEVSGDDRSKQAARTFFAALTGVVAAHVMDHQTASAVAVGLGVRTTHGLYIASMATAPHARRQGHAAAIVSALRASAPGAPSVLNVVPSNPAVALYESLGFTTSHQYSYFRLLD